MSKTYSELVKNNTNELYQMALRVSKTFGLVPAPVPVPQDSLSASGTRIILHDQQDDEYDFFALKKLRDELAEIVQIALSSA